MPNISIIKIKENGLVDNAFSLLVSFIDENGAEEEINVKYTDSSYLKTNKLLEWHFEEYISTPYDTANYVISLDAIEKYGKNLFQSIIIDEIAYQFKKAYESSGPENIVIEIIGDSPAFHSICWETLWNEKHSSALAVQGTIFYRRNIKPSIVKAIPKPAAMINLLIVTARPNEDKDVNYRTIQRPLVDMIQQTETPVRPHILRPGTYESLIRHLDGKSGYYHIIHFDLHGSLLDYPSYNKYQESLEENEANKSNPGIDYGLTKLNPAYFKNGRKSFLFFESKKRGIPVPVEGELLASMLENYKIPICILNACQSAKQSNSDHETSLGRILNKKGLQAVIAMRYSISVTAAQIIMKTLYKQLYDGENIDRAIANCRKELYRSKKRNANYNYEIELEDWLLPVVFKNSTPILKTTPLTIDEETELFERTRLLQQLNVELQYGFFGRDLEILKIEKSIILKSNILLLQGMGGAGKTTLLKYLAGWWLRTGFIEKEFYFGYDVKAFSLKEIIRTIAITLYSKNEYNLFTEVPFELQLNRIVAKFQANRFLLVLDNTESITGERLSIPNTLTNDEQQEIKRFLAMLKGSHSYIIIGSRADEAWLKTGTFEQNTFLLGGLDKEAAGNFAQRIMLDNNVNIQYVIKDPAFGKLMTLLAGYPLALKAILPNLKKKSAGDILTELMQGMPNLDADNIQTRTESVIKCIEYAHSNLSEETQSILLCLAPFQSFVDLRPEIITHYFNTLKSVSGIIVPTFNQLNEIVKAAENAGLMQRLTAENLMVLQPLFTYFLRNNLSLKEDKFQQSLQHAFAEHYQSMASSLYSKIIDPDPNINLDARALMKLQYENFYMTLVSLLKWGKPTILIFSILEEYLDKTRQNEKRLELAEMVNQTLEYQTFSKLSISQLIEALNVLNRLNVIYTDLRQFEKAYKLHPFLYEIIYSDYSKEKIPNYLKSIVHLDIGRSYMQNALEGKAIDAFDKALKLFEIPVDNILIANTKRNIGVVLSRQEKWTESKKCFNEALENYDTIKDFDGMGVVYQNLAVIANKENNFELFISYSEQAIKLFRLIGSKNQEGEIYMNMGVFYLEKKLLTNAFENTRKALGLFLESDAVYPQIMAFLNLATISQADGNSNQAKEYFKKAIAIAHNYPEDMSLLEKMFTAIGNYVRETGDMIFGRAMFADILKYIPKEVFEKFKSLLKF